MSNETWAGLFSKYFRPITDEEAQSWVEDLKRDWHVNMLTESELCSVVKEMVAEKDAPKRPTLRDLLIAIRKHRKLRNEIRDEFDAPMERCTICGGSGLAQCSWETNGEGLVILGSVFLDTDARGEVVGHGSVNCTCANGEKLQRQHQDPDSLRRKVAKLYQEYLRKKVA